MSFTHWAALAAVPLLCCSCGLLDSGQVELATQVIQQMETQGTVTAAQAEALRQAIAVTSVEPWYYQLGRMALEVGLAVAGVRMWRGPSATTAERAARVAASAK